MTSTTERRFTRGPWVILDGWPSQIVPEAQRNFPVGGSVDPEQDAKYAQPIASVHLEKPFPGHERFVHRRFNSDEALANATLIAQAPALVEALEGLLAKYDFGEAFPDDHPITRARTVLSRALGRME